MPVYFCTRRWAAGLGVLIVTATVHVAAAQQPRQDRAAGGSDQQSAPDATATLKDAMGQEVGRAELTDTPNGVMVKVTGLTAPAGTHAFHIHQTGRCEAPSFESAGEHFAPEDSQHGFEVGQGPHAGDLPNIHVPESGGLDFEFIASDVTLDQGESGLLDADGSALVLHAGADDYQSQPAGDSGARLACGVIER